MSSGFERLRAGVAISLVGAGAVPAAAQNAWAANTHPTHIPVSFSTTTPLASTANHRSRTVRISDVGHLRTGSVTAFGGHAWVQKFDCNGTPSNQTCAPPGSQIVHGLFGETKVGGQYYKTPQGIVDVGSGIVGGKTVFGRPKTMSHLKTKVRIDFMDNHQLLRAVVTLKNTSTRTARATVRMRSQLYSPDPVTVHDDDSGDNALDASDSWIVTTSLDTFMLLARGNALPAVEKAPTGDGEELDAYAFKVKPHKTVRLLYFMLVDNTSSVIDTRSSEFDDGASLDAASLLTGLDAKTLSQIVNWTGLPTT